MPAPKPALEADWLPKPAAAKLLGVAVRQLERRTRQGYIESRREERQINQTTAPVVYSRVDILALKAGKPNIHAREVPVEPESHDDYFRESIDAPKLQPAAGGPAAKSTALAVRDAADPFAGLAVKLAGPPAAGCNFGASIDSRK